MNETKAPTVFQKPAFHRAMKIVLILLIVLYPLISSFYGIDLGNNTGIAVYNYTHLFKKPSAIGLVGLVPSAIGAVWMRCFPMLGVWGLNLLEVALELFLTFAVYRLLKPRLGDLVSLLGLLAAIIAMGGTVNAFTANQCLVLLMALQMSCIFCAVTGGKLRYSLLAGALFAAAVFTAQKGLLSVFAFLLYILDFILCRRRVSRLLKHIGCVLAGTAAAGGAIYLGGRLLRVKSILPNSSNSLKTFAPASLLEGMVKRNQEGLIIGACFLAAIVLLLIAALLVVRPARRVSRRILYIVVSALPIAVAYYVLKFANGYGTLPSQPQSNRETLYVMGVLYMIAFIHAAWHLTSRVGKREMAYLSLMAILLPLILTAGSGSSILAATQGLWFLAPLMVYIIWKLAFDADTWAALQEMSRPMGVAIRKWAWCTAILALCAVLLLEFGDMVLKTNNYDSPQRRTLTAAIDSDAVKYLKTTQREADAVNGLLEEIRGLSKEDLKGRKLLVYGNSMLLYSVLDMEPFVRPWVTASDYSDKKLKSNLKTQIKKQSKRPIVVFCRTNSNYGFSEYLYSSLIKSEKKQKYSGKVTSFVSFLDKYKYNVQYINDYYCLFYPPDIASYEDEDYRQYIWVK